MLTLLQRLEPMPRSMNATLASGRVQHQAEDASLELERFVDVAHLERDVVEADEPRTL